MTRLHVAVIAGGPSSEAEVSRKSAAAVSRALAEAGHRVALLELDAKLPITLATSGADVVFPVTHGPLGEDGCLQGLLEVLDLPYVGAGVLASALAANKPEAKVVFAARGLPLAEGIVVHRDEDLTAAAARATAALGTAVVVKPAAAGSAIGVTRLREGASRETLRSALERALAIDARALVERFVAGLEVTCGVLEDERGSAQPLPPTLIASEAADWYDFTSRYANGGSRHQCPAPLPSATLERIQAIAVAAHGAIGARDLSRADFVVTQDGADVTLLEVNTLPGMTATSLFPEAAAVSGVPFTALCDRLTRQAHARPRRVPPPVMPMP
jgi:D-alanine-D-alanine ligase